MMQLVFKVFTLHTNLRMQRIKPVLKCAKFQNIMTWIVQEFSFGLEVFNNESFVGKLDTK